MDETYAGRKSRNLIGLAVIGMVAVIIIAGTFIYLKSKEKIVSPIPKEPAFQVIFYTPTSAPITPSSTPSATPKVKKVPTSTPKPATPTATPKTSPSPTVKPT